MQTVRFAKVVEKCGEPESYLLLMDPAKDRTFQSAIKAERVMTVLQPTVGTKADRGEIGFEPGPARQFLVFPKTLRAFKGRTVVGIKYNLLQADETSKGERAPASQPEKKRKHEPAKKEKPQPVAKSEPKVVAPVPKQPPEPEKLIEFSRSEKEEDEDDELTISKKQLRHAMSLLEQGKAVAAFNLLKRLAGD